MRGWKWFLDMVGMMVLQIGAYGAGWHHGGEWMVLFVSTFFLGRGLSLRCRPWPEGEKERQCKAQPDYERGRADGVKHARSEGRPL